MLCDSGQLLRNRGRWQHKVDASGANGTLRQAAVPGRLLVLSKSNSSGGFDRPEALGSVGRSARQDHTNGALVGVFRKRAQKMIDGKMHSALQHPRRKAQASI